MEADKPDRQPALIALALVGLVAAAFGGALACGFVTADDPGHLPQNRVVLHGDIAGAFTETPAALWIPVTWLSYMAEVSLAGLRPWVFHLTNLLPHAANALLVWRWLEGATGRRWPSAAVAACFAAHPLGAESVAWISERKNVLSTCFWLLALIAWTRYARGGKRRDYALAAATGALAMPSKPMAVTLAGTLFLLGIDVAAAWLAALLAAAWPRTLKCAAAARWKSRPVAGPPCAGSEPSGNGGPHRPRAAEPERGELSPLPNPARCCDKCPLWHPSARSFSSRSSGRRPISPGSVCARSKGKKAAASSPPSR